MRLSLAELELIVDAVNVVEAGELDEMVNLDLLERLAEKLRIELAKRREKQYKNILR